MAARRPLTFRLRAGFGGGAMAIAIWAMLVWGSSASFSGKALFEIVFWITGLGALVIGTISATDSISLERREGTLPLLFLTDLSVWQIVTGKWAAAIINPFLTLLAVFPSLAIWQLVGGLAPQDLFRAILVCLTTLLTSVTTTLLLSTIARQRGTVVTGSVLVLAVINPLWLWPFSPWLSWFQFCLGLMAFVGFAMSCLGSAAYFLRRNWQDDFAESPGTHDRSQAFPFAHDERYPVASLLLRSVVSTRSVVWLARAGWLVATGTIALLLLSGWLIGALISLFAIHLGSVVALIARTVWTFSKRQSDGSLEILLCTPLGNDDIFAGFARFLHLRMRSFLFAIVAFDLMVSAFLWAAGKPQLTSFPIAMGATFCIILATVAWVGVYRSLMMNLPLVAAFWTFWRLSFFPPVISALFLWAPRTNYLKVCFFWVGFTAFLGVFFGSDARRVLLQRGRELLLRPACDKPPHIENDWSFINWDNVEPAEVPASNQAA